jgi:hypothetical protein
MEERLIVRGETPVKRFKFNATGSINKCATWTFSGMPIYNQWNISTAESR